MIPTKRKPRLAVLAKIAVIGTVVFSASLVAMAKATATATTNTAPRVQRVTTTPAIRPVSSPRLPTTHQLARGARRVVGLMGGPTSTSRSRSAPTGQGPSPVHRVSGPVGADKFADFSTNWAGQIMSGSVYSGVSAAWLVPSVTASIASEYSATWIGIDGTETSSLIQTGTEQQSTGGVTTYFPWLELLPGSSLEIDAPVAPGDQMEAAITQTAVGVWTIFLEDESEDWYYSNAFSYSTPGLSAEWIEEAPTIGGGQSTLADFDQASFTQMAVNAADGDSELTPCLMVDPSGTAIIAYPGSYNSATESFTDFAGSPPPVISSVTPSAGSTAGGEQVYITGAFLIGVSSVDFGSTASEFDATGTGSVTAVAPAHSAGVVDVTLTTPGGRTTPIALDHFTYNSPAPPPSSAPISAPGTTSNDGYWLVGGDGGIFTFGSAQFYGSTGDLQLQRPVVGVAPTSIHTGYWLVGSDGGTFAFGSAGYFGSIPGLGIAPTGSSGPGQVLSAPIVGIVPSSDGQGYFMVGSDGGVFAFGDAQYEGSCPGIGGCAGAAVAVIPDASGHGYWLVTATGNVYAFGDASYYGGPGAAAGAVTSAVRTPNGGGYWILSANGGVYAYGNAGYLGTPPRGATGASDPATSIFSTADGGGYWVTAADGSVYAFGNAPDDGSMAGHPLNAPVIAAVGW
jgi:hypothetical protein